MTYNNETALTTPQEFILPGMMNNGFSAEDIGDDFDGLRLSFQRIKIPGGGALQFEIPGDNPEDPDYDKTIVGVILYNHSANAYWPAGSEYDENVAPFCSSYDGKTGQGLPGGACQFCEMNQYGTDPNGGKGKACKNMRTLYILRSGEAMPVQLSLPPTSLGPFSDFVNMAFATRRRPTWSAIVEIGLKRVDNGTNKYSVATFRKVGDFTQEQIPQIKQYVDNFRTQIKELLKQRALETEGRMEANGVPDAQPRYTTTETGEHFTVSGAGVINGDVDDLPL